jgi:AraC family transcriptional regulator
MKHLKAGQTFWNKQNSIKLEGTILTEVEYTPNIKELPWHYHENFLFYYHLKGRLDEVNKKKTVNCTAGTLLLHHWQDPHYDKNFSADANFFHIEIENNWFLKHQVKPTILEGSMQLENPALKPLFHKIHKEIKLNDATSQISVDGLLLQSIAEITRATYIEKFGLPVWVNKVKEILNDGICDKITLESLSLETGIHPVHLSKEFPKYFNTGFGQYIRNIRVGKATHLLSNKNITLSEIAYDCGFADQSHFIRCFKDVVGITPLKYRNLITKS